MVEKKVWENPLAPSGQLHGMFELAEKFRAVQQAPAVRMDHFLLAVILKTYPPYAEDVLKLFEEVRDEWLKEL